jgi:hypothetical protein
VALQFTNELLVLAQELIMVNKRLGFRKAEGLLTSFDRQVGVGPLSESRRSIWTISRPCPSTVFLQECGSLLMNSSAPLTIGEIESKLLRRKRGRLACQDLLRATSISLHVLAAHGCVMVSEGEGVRKWAWAKARPSNLSMSDSDLGNDRSLESPALMAV